MFTIGLDFETYGSVDLTKHGLDRYVSDPFFRPLIVSYYYLSTNSLIHRGTFDFVEEFEGSVASLRDLLAAPDCRVVAHNAGFEARVLEWLGMALPAEAFVDSAVVARAAGAGGKLEAAAPQLLDVDKMASGMSLIRLFSIPGTLQEENGNGAFDPRIVAQNPEKWAEFKSYCELDAELGYGIYESNIYMLPTKELAYSATTMKMNRVGWPVDVAAVEEMQRRYLENLAELEAEFRSHENADELNFNSLKQMKEWCLERGVKATSFDEKNVAKMVTALDKKLESPTTKHELREGYESVRRLLEVKQELGGSSLKKLAVILNSVGADGRLRDQYLHCGAGQTLRTTGRSVQMQNLKRLKTLADMDTLHDDSVHWSNERMAENLRQVFRSSHPKGSLIVGDFKSVESRGLAWLAGEEWKLQEYREGRDLYKVLAAKIFSLSYEAVTAGQRTTGKVGELSCGYAAGPGAVLDFAKGMGVEMSEGEASKLVYDWRDANPKIVEFWAKLDQMLHDALRTGDTQVFKLPDGFVLSIYHVAPPGSLLTQAPGTLSLVMEIQTADRSTFMRRIFHGCYEKGRNIRYFKPSALKNGNLWTPSYVDPKTKQTRFFEIYGGKVAGILTQSFCRELFFQTLKRVDSWAVAPSNVTLVGQFHDEIILDWVPPEDPVDRNSWTWKRTVGSLEATMSDPGRAQSFPLEADIKYDYRYIK